MIKNTADPGEEAKNAFMRIHFAKIKHNKDEGKFEIIDNFKALSFTTVTAPQDSNYMLIQDLEEDTVFSILKTGESQFSIRSPWAEILGEVIVDEKNGQAGPVCVEIFTKDRTVRLQAARMQQIEKSSEFLVTHTKSGDVIGRINAVPKRSKAVVSMQPELDVLHRVRIIATALILMQIYDKAW
ncbi:uncharacterized protein LOC110843863 [Folsomia candida]|uniref:Uncharacterized protein n=1 Tax=Folsomia candida TaxID=158441 RepID=A0A226EQV6_FOLCA|nr:uncharacterized protein LOC110843863 [Folsomia candida]OXA60013.1 hypothetical protein Fcan01_06348 [Folsomia candida]